jgi:hypothetical protein
MTRREFFAIENNTWKSHHLRTAYYGNKPAMPRSDFLLHTAVNAQTMFVKSAIMALHLGRPAPRVSI